MPGRRSSRNVRREFTFPWRRFVCALVLFIVGLIFCIIGLVKVELAFGIVGIIAVLPGSYQLFIILQTARGIRGYRVEEVYEQVVTEERVPGGEDVVYHDKRPSFMEDDLEAAGSTSSGGGLASADAAQRQGVAGWGTALPAGSRVTRDTTPGRTEAALAAADAQGIDLQLQDFSGSAGQRTPPRVSSRGALATLPPDDADDLALVDDDASVV